MHFTVGGKLAPQSFNFLLLEHDLFLLRSQSILHFLELIGHRGIGS